MTTDVYQYFTSSEKEGRKLCRGLGYEHSSEQFDVGEELERLAVEEQVTGDSSVHKKRVELSERLRVD